MKHISSAIQSVKEYLSKGNRAQWCLFLLFTLMLFLKSVLFHFDSFHSILISTLWRSPITFFNFYLSKLIFPLFIAGFIFVTQKRWWTIIVSVLIDIWCIANLIYLKTYDSYLSFDDVMLISNLNGAWGSVTTYIDWIMLSMIVLTIIWLFVCNILSKNDKSSNNYKPFILNIIVVVILSMLHNYKIYTPNEQNEDVAAANEFIKIAKIQDSYNSTLKILPFYVVYKVASQGDIHGKTDWCEQYVREFSIIDYLFADLVYHFAYPNMAGDIIEPDEEICESFIPLFRFEKNKKFSDRPLVIILVESLESWPLQHDIENVNVTPNLRKIITNKNVFYCKYLKNQTLEGNSGDGQMIVNAGLLPIQQGVACMSYANNVFPNIGECYQNATIINPWPHIWNQDSMTIRYGFNHIVEPRPRHTWKDQQVLDSTAYIVQRYHGSPSYTLSITLSTHSPFTASKNRLNISAPSVLNRYMQCLNYTDSCIGACVDVILNDSILNQSTVVITGDHTIFKSFMLHEFKDYAKEQNLSIASGDNFCPLIIYSPEIDHNIQITDTCYQMDIYPTIMHLIGCEDYYWKGVGVNLLDSVARKNRKISEEEAYRLSDLLIRSNAFELYKQGKLFDNQNNATAQ